MQRSIQQLRFQSFLRKTNPRRFFSYVKTKKCSNIRVAPLPGNETILISNDEKARVMNNQFCSVLTKEDFRIPIYRR